MKQNLKTAVMSLFVMIAGCSSMVAQTIVKHIVDRGETLASIAQKYNTTTEKLIELNPEAAQFIYVGMGLNVPQGAEKTENTETVQSFVPTMSQGEDSGHQNTVNGTVYGEREKKWEIEFYFKYGFLQKTPNFKGYYYSGAVAIGGNYNITELFYAGAKIGYNGVELNNSDLKMETHVSFIMVPLEIGYRCYVNEKKTIAVIPHAGLDFNIGLSGKTKVGTGSDKIKENLKVGGKIAAGGIVGLNIKINDWIIGGAYVFPFNDDHKGFFGKNGYAAITLGFGV